MFVILVTYKKSLETVDKYLAEHRAFLDDCYRKKFLIASGPKNPRNGGVILSLLTNRDQLEALVKKDPFYIHEIADYQIIEFNPTKWDPEFSIFIADGGKNV